MWERELASKWASRLDAGENWRFDDRTSRGCLPEGRDLLCIGDYFAAGDASRGSGTMAIAWAR